MSSLEEKVKRNFKRIKISPTSLIIGGLFGSIDAMVPPHSKNGLGILNQDPSFLQYLLCGLGLVGLNYTNDVNEHRTKKNCIYHIKVCFGNYTLGYAAGYALTKIFT